MAAKDILGRHGEELACAYIEQRGWTVLERNWRCRQGEIDIIALDGGEYVFVEVKTRSSLAFGDPLQAVTAPKLARLRRLAATWCAADPGTHHDIRLDVIGILISGPHPPVIDHLVRVF
jgi:putative endonuclease